MRGTLALIAPALLVLGACSKGPPPPRAVETDIPEEMRGAQPVKPIDAGEGTAMKDRVAVVGVLNKRNNLSRDFTMKPGEAQRWGDVIVQAKIPKQ